MYTLQVIFSSL